MDAGLKNYPKDDLLNKRDKKPPRNRVS